MHGSLGLGLLKASVQLTEREEGRKEVLVKKTDNKETRAI
jgi:hypothetical protein